MIPVAIVFGLVFGRWWRATLITAAVVWPIMLVAGGVMEVERGLVGAAGLAVANALVGVIVHQAVLAVVRLIRTPGPAFLDKLR